MKSNNYSWAKAIYDLGIENNSYKEYYEFAKEIIEVASTTDLIKFLSNLNITSKDKKELFESVEDKNLKNFLYLLIDNKETKSLKNIFNTFIKIYNQENSIKEGVVWTTSKLDSKSVKKIEEILSKKTKAKLNLENKIDLDLIGGIKVDLDGTTYDYSVKKQVENLTIELLTQKEGK